jgi:uroporphyrinogen-III synthase
LSEAIPILHAVAKIMTLPLPLTGLNIVVTRPREQAAALAQRIASLGGNAILLPLLEISPAGDQEKLHAQLERIARFDLLIFISPNAVKYGMAAIGALPPGVRVATVGQGGAQALRELGVADVMAPAERFDSEGLLALPELRDVCGWNVAILRGDGGRELLGDTLKARGASVEYVTCYRRGKPSFDAGALWAAQPDALTVTSSEALCHLREMFPESDRDRLTAIPLFVPHQRIAAMASQQGWRNVRQTASGDDGLLAGLIAWAETKGST